MQQTNQDIIILCIFHELAEGEKNVPSNAFFRLFFEKKAAAQKNCPKQGDFLVLLGELGNQTGRSNEMLAQFRIFFENPLSPLRKY